MNAYSIGLGTIFILIGIAYITIPKKIFPYDEWTLTTKGFKKNMIKMTDEWLEKARSRGILFIFGGLMIVFIEEIVKILIK